MFSEITDRSWEKKQNPKHAKGDSASFIKRQAQRIT